MNNHREMAKVARYLIQCRTRQLNHAGEHLAHQGFECFNPNIRGEKLHAGKVKQQEQPMFPGYLFARIIIGQDNRTALDSIRSESRVTRCGKTLPVDDNSVASLRHRCTDALQKPVRAGGRAFTEVDACSGLVANPVAVGGTERVAPLLNNLNSQEVASLAMASMINRTGSHFAAF